MRTEPEERNSTSRAVSQLYFAVAGRTSITCVTSWLASPTSPYKKKSSCYSISFNFNKVFQEKPTWTMRMGSESTSLASFSILFLKVALKRRVCRSGLTWLHIDRTCGSVWKLLNFCVRILKNYEILPKPMSNILSASSNTKKVTRVRLVALILTRSIIRPNRKVKFGALV